MASNLGFSPPNVGRYLQVGSRFWRCLTSVAAVESDFRLEGSFVFPAVVLRRPLMTLEMIFLWRQKWRFGETFFGTHARCPKSTEGLKGSLETTFALRAEMTFRWNIFWYSCISAVKVRRACRKPKDDTWVWGRKCFFGETFFAFILHRCKSTGACRKPKNDARDFELSLTSNSMCARRFTARLQRLHLVAKHHSTSAAFWPAWRTPGLIPRWITHNRLLLELAAEDVNPHRWLTARKR